MRHQCALAWRPLFLPKSTVHLGTRHSRYNHFSALNRLRTETIRSSFGLADLSGGDGGSAVGSISSAADVKEQKSPCAFPARNDGRVVGSNKKYRVFLSVGSNLGDRYQNIASALENLCFIDPSTHVSRYSFLYETAPMYILDQPSFLNGAVEIQTNLEPTELLSNIKQVEMNIGRNIDPATAQRNGPRPVDLDILFYDRKRNEGDKTDGKDSYTPMVVDEPELVVPHKSIAERMFVLAPLRQITGDHYRHPCLSFDTIGKQYETLRNEEKNSDLKEQSLVRVLPLPRGRMLCFNETLIMGILNVTPDSFSDGGRFNSSVDVAVDHALQMVADGANIIDVGGESTRPGAEAMSINDQIDRTVPVIQMIREVSDVPISIDTRLAEVAKAAVDAGADIVNDVSGGQFDQNMLPTVAKLGVPIVLMHMRGTPESMQSMAKYDNVVDEVTRALQNRSNEAEKIGIPRWSLILDPGIGFAKDLDGNLSLLNHYTEIQYMLGDIPLLLGTSRKGFIGRLTGEIEADQRDFATVGSCIAALCIGRDSRSATADNCNILRVHNVKGTKQASILMDSIRKAN